LPPALRSEIKMLRAFISLAPLGGKKWLVGTS
jgi:hypothetical protein